MKKLKIGQILYSLQINNITKRKPTLTPVEVTKIGRKYFTAGKGGLARQYHLSDWREKTDYTRLSKLYVSKQAYFDGKVSNEICKQLGNISQYGQNILNLPVDVLREIKEIIGSKK